MLNSKKYIIHTNGQEKPSLFLVDLKKKNAEEEKENNKNKKISRVLFKQYFYSSKNFIKSLFKKKTKLNRKINTRYSKIFFKYNYYFSELFFYPVFKFLFLIFLKIVKLILDLSYKVGYLTIFLIRFFVLLLLSLNKFFNKNGKYIFSKIKKYLQRAWTKRKDIKKNKKSKKNLKEFLPIPQEKKPILINYFTKIKNKKNLFYDFNFSKLILKRAFLFVLILIVLIIPFKAFTYYNSLLDLRGKVLGVSEKGISNLKQAAGSASDLNFSKAEKNFSAASNNFLKAQVEIKEVNGILGVLAKIIPDNNLKLAADANNFLSSAHLSSDLAAQLSASIDDILKNKNKPLPKIFFVFSNHLKIAQADATSLQKNINSINSNSLPKKYQKNFTNLKDKISLISSSLDELRDILEKAKIFLGFKMDKRYLLVFQNNTEMRASGGFIGSYALVDFSNGKIKNIEVPAGGSYDTEGGLKELVRAPQPLWLVNPLWHFWDANWWPNWPSSAHKLAWFLDKSSGPSVDGVISFTPTVIENLLKIIGPIDMQTKYGKTITADNFWSVVQAIVEKKPKALVNKNTEDIITTSSTPTTVSPKPKKIIGDLLEKIKVILPSRLNRNTFLNLFSTMTSSLDERQIMFYFNDKSLEKTITDLGWGGRVKNTFRDYLMVVNSNIAGGKSDKKIKENISHNAEIMPNGDIVVSLKIIRRHTAKKGELFSGVRNVDWMRIYVPLGSKLLEARGFNTPAKKYFSTPNPEWKIDPDIAKGEGKAEINILSGTKIYNEFNKTVFANWSMVDPGKTAVIYLRYRLPFKIYFLLKDGNDNFKNTVTNFFAPEKKKALPYSLLIQKQPGSLGDLIESRLILPSGYKIIWRYPAKNDSIKTSGWKIQSDLKTDKFWAVLITNKNN